MRVPRALLRNTVTVEAYQNGGPRGPQYAAPVSLVALMQDNRRVSLDSEGRTVSFDILMITRPEDGVLAPQSRVTWNGGTYRVLTAAPFPDERRPDYIQTNLGRVE